MFLDSRRAPFYNERRMLIRPILSAAAIDEALPRLANAIAGQFDGDESVRAFILLDGGMWFGCDLLRRLPLRFIAGTIRVSSYGANTESSGTLAWRDPPPDCRGERVLLIDDILDTGLTLQSVAQTLLDAGARSVHTAVAVDKRERRRNGVTADFALCSVESGFVVGYGMDRNGLYRNLPYIGVVEADEGSEKGLTGIPLEAK